MYKAYGNSFKTRQLQLITLDRLNTLPQSLGILVQWRTRHFSTTPTIQWKKPKDIQNEHK